MVTSKIKELRKKQGLMQKELAAAVGVSQPYIHDLENNHRGARPETLAKIAEVLGVGVGDLIEQKAG